MEHTREIFKIWRNGFERRLAERDRAAPARKERRARTPKPIDSNLGSCPTGQHKTDFRQCGFAGCLDLSAWAKANGYRFRFEESYKAEHGAHVKGDGRWFVEVLCKNGLIYPYGGTELLCYAKGGVAFKLASLPAVKLHQSDGPAKVFKFPVERLKEVAAILKPRQRRTYTPEQREVLRKRLQSLREKGANGPRINAEAEGRVNQG